tara:strand:+ start:655 stop:1362 length:708 start_codon:yes stop_codon:yes gene_type:complete
MNNLYQGWELSYFDQADNFRKYEFSFCKNYISGKTAEIGPGTGENIKYYFDRVTNLHLYETSQTLFDVLKKRTTTFPNIKLLNQPFRNISENFDTIIYLDVIEHIQDDQEEILNACSKLNKNGKLIINVPAFNILFSKFDKDVGHFRRYNKKRLLDIFSKIDVDIKELKYFDSIGFFFSLLSKIIGSSKSNFAIKIKIWNFLVPISKVLDKILFHSFGKSLICVVEKKPNDNKTL